jgi:hypothetical protein
MYEPWMLKIDLSSIGRDASRHVSDEISVVDIWWYKRYVDFVDS